VSRSTARNYLEAASMMSFRGTRLADTRLPLGTVWLLESLAESKGRQALFQQQSPQILRALREMALVESTESSNRIEGVTVDRERLRPLVLGRARPRDRSEEEVVGYKKALAWIHTSHDKVPVESTTILRLHGLAQEGSVGDAGVWKRSPNEIVEVLPNGARRVRFVPVEPVKTPAAVKELCLGYRHVVAQQRVTPLLATACLVLDFLCIHPFRDGNGRVARLLTLLAAYHHGYEVGRYVSLERIVEQSRQEFYDTLGASSSGWHDGRHDVLPWFNYLLTVFRTAYREFEDRAARQRPTRGAKAELIAYALESLTGPFGIADVERLCPNVSRDMIRVVLRRWKREGRLAIVRRGRDARWEKRAVKPAARSSTG
jgi:Fic family protein